LSWSREFHELKYVGGMWHPQANHSTTKVVAQCPNVEQLSIKVQQGMMGIIGGLIFLYHSNC